MLNVGFIGCGGIAHPHICALRCLNEVNVVAAMDTDEAAAGVFASRYQIPIVTSDIEVLLGNREIDAVVIVTPSAFHAPLASRALGAGKHVLVQKPPALHVDDLQSVASAQAESGCVFMTSFFEMFHPAFVEARRLFREGALGDVVLVRANMSWGSPQEAGWRYSKEVAGGGIIADGQVHHLALYDWLFGVPRPARVFAATSGGSDPLARHEVEHVASTTITDAERVVELSGSHSISSGNQQLTRPRGEWASFYERIELFGTDGTVILAPSERPSLTVFAPKLGGRQPISWSAPVLTSTPWDRRVNSMHFNSDEDPWVAMHEHFVNAIDQGVEPVSGLRFSFGVVSLLEAAYTAMRTGASVKVEAVAIGPHGLVNDADQTVTLTREN